MTLSLLLLDDEPYTVRLTDCLECGNPCGPDYCSAECYCLGESKEQCPAGHIHDEGAGCEECDELENPLTAEERRARLDELMRGLR